MIELLPLAPSEFLLVAIAFFVAVWNTSIGPSGAIMFVTMATLLPPAAAIPIHAVTSTAANAVRVLILRDLIDWRFVSPFVFGGLLGLSAGVPFLAIIVSSEDVLQIVLAIFILVTTWIPLKRFSSGGDMFAAVGGAVSSFLTLFVGATTPLVAAIIGQGDNNHRRVIATSAGCMLFQHAAKIPIFGTLGFCFVNYTDLLFCLVLSTSTGAWVGRQLLIRVPERGIRPVFNALITLLALNLLWRGLSG